MIKVIEVAKRFVNLTECKPNAQWNSKTVANCDQLSVELLELMKQTGWTPPLPYCAAFVDGVYREAYKDEPEKLAIIKKVLTPSAMQSYNNAKAYWSKTPVPGCIFVMQMANGTTGHCGIVGESITKDSFSTIEGNTSPGPSSGERDRNGDGVYSKVRKMNFTHSDSLHLIGFIDFKF